MADRNNTYKVTARTRAQRMDQKRGEKCDSAATDENPDLAAHRWGDLGQVTETLCAMCVFCKMAVTTILTSEGC